MKAHLAFPRSLLPYLLFIYLTPTRFESGSSIPWWPFRSFLPWYPSSLYSSNANLLRCCGIPLWTAHAGAQLSLMTSPTGSALIQPWRISFWLLFRLVHFGNYKCPSRPSLGSASWWDWQCFPRLSRSWKPHISTYLQITPTLVSILFSSLIDWLTKELLVWVVVPLVLWGLYVLI